MLVPHKIWQKNLCYLPSLAFNPLGPSNGAPQCGEMLTIQCLHLMKGISWSCWACIHTAMVYNLLNKQWFALVSPPPLNPLSKYSIIKASDKCIKPFLTDWRLVFLNWILASKCFQNVDIQCGHGKVYNWVYEALTTKCTEAL